MLREKKSESWSWCLISSLQWKLAEDKKKKKERGISSCYLRSRFTLTPQRGFSFLLHCLHRMHMFPPSILNEFGQRKLWNKSKVCAALPACTVLVTLSCAWGDRGPLPFLQLTLLHKKKKDPFFLPLCHTPNHPVSVSSPITANQGKHTLQSGTTSVSTAVRKLLQCQNKSKIKIKKEQ